MPEPPPEPVRITFSRGTWIALVAFALVMFAGITTQLLLIEDQRSTTDRQLRTAVRQANRAIPLMERTRPLVDQTTRSLPAVRRLGRGTQELLGQLTPLSRDLREARAPEQLQAAGALARTLLEADVGEMTRALQRADLPRLATDLRDVSSELLRQQRLRRALESVPRMEDLLRESVAIQRETLAIAQRTQDAADRAARAAESIDRKTGPTVAPTSGG